MGKTIVYYYTSPNGDQPITKFIDSLDSRQQAKLLRIINYVEVYGLQSILPHVKKLTGTPLWEIRILGKDNIRTIYAIMHNNSILIVNGFIKKSQKTPTKEIDLSLARFKEWVQRND